MEKACAEKLKKMAWLMYIDVKTSLNQEDLSELAFLIVAVIHSVIMRIN